MMEAADRQLQKKEELPQNEAPRRLGKNAIVTNHDNWMVVGVRGAGKTTFINQLMPRLHSFYPNTRLYYLDTKNQGDFDRVQGHHITGGDRPPPLIHQPGGVLVWHYPLVDLSVISDWFTAILRRGEEAIVDIDELANIVTDAGHAPHGLTLILKQGRGANISVIVGTQEAAYIPRQVPGQTTHLVRFHLQDEYDERKMARLLGFRGPDRYMEPKYPFGFFYRRLDIQAPTYEYRNWQEFFS